MVSLAPHSFLRRSFRQPIRYGLGAEQKNGENGEKTEYRSISDYMGGHHAGKFDFDPRICGVTALNYEKSIIFGDATTCPNSDILADLDEDNGPPKWSLRPVDVTSIQGNIGCSNSSPAVVTNEEISWEPFYATIETSTRKTQSITRLEGIANIWQPSTPWRISTSYGSSDIQDFFLGRRQASNANLFGCENRTKVLDLADRSRLG